MSLEFDCSITAHYDLLDEGLLYMTVLERLNSLSRGEFSENIAERVLSSPEASLRYMVLRNRNFRMINGIRRVKGLTVTTRNEAGVKADSRDFSA